MPVCFCLRSLSLQREGLGRQSVPTPTAPPSRYTPPGKSGTLEGPLFRGQQSIVSGSIFVWQNVKVHTHTPEESFSQQPDRVGVKHGQTPSYTERPEIEGYTKPAGPLLATTVSKQTTLHLSHGEYTIGNHNIYTQIIPMSRHNYTQPTAVKPWLI